MLYVYIQIISKLWKVLCKFKKSNNGGKNIWKVIKDSIRNTQWFDTVTKINSEAGQIANTYNNFFLQIAENRNNERINVYKALQLQTRLMLVKLWSWK